MLDGKLRGKYNKDTPRCQPHNEDLYICQKKKDGANEEKYC